MKAIEILDVWKYMPFGWHRKVEQKIGDAWLHRSKDGEYMSLVAVDPELKFSEEFSKAKLQTREVFLPEFGTTNALVLSAPKDCSLFPFAVLTEHFLSMSENHESGECLSTDPRSWWNEWKELLGNQDTNQIAYDTLAELIVLRYFAQQGIRAVWRGPEAATYDICIEKTYYEVKSTVSKHESKITLSNQFQLIPPEGKNLNLMFCRFEETGWGFSIDSLIDELVDTGLYTREDLNQKVALIGYEEGRVARQKQFDLLEMSEYEVNDQFPAIRETSFIDGHWPLGIDSVTYVVSLNSVKPKMRLTSSTGKDRFK